MKKSLKKHIIELLEESGSSLAIEEIISGLGSRSVNKTNQQIRNALNAYSCKEILRVGENIYNLTYKILNGSFYRYTLNAEEINKGYLSCDEELRYIFDAYWPWKHTERELKFLYRDKLVNDAAINFHGKDAIPRWGVNGFTDFFRTAEINPDDDVIIKIFDLIEGEYELIPQKRTSRNEQLIKTKNQEVADLAEQILLRINSKCCWPSELIRRLTASYSFKEECPPDNLVKILLNDKRFVVHTREKSDMVMIYLADKFIPDEHGIPVLKSHLDSVNNSSFKVLQPKKNPFARYKVTDNFIKVYQFKITLMDIKPPIWRRIQVPETYTFWDLHIAIQDSMGWMDSHLHEFRIRHPRSGREIYLGIPVDEDENDPHQIFPGWEHCIADFFGEYNGEALYVYDFGDDWRHMVTLEDIKIREKNVQYPLCLDGERACPPEDVGSIPGYENFLKIIKNPKHEEYKDYMEWASSQIETKDEHQPLKKGKRNKKIDPEHFDVKEVVFDDPAERIKSLSRDGL